MTTAIRPSTVAREADMPGPDVTPARVPRSAYTRRLDELHRTDVAAAGGKGANLGEMIAAGLPVPPGFVVTVDAFRAALEPSGTLARIRAALSSLNVDDPAQLAAAARVAQDAVRAIEMPADVRGAITSAYRALVGAHDTPVAARSSATAEDAASASFAGMFESYLGVTGAEDLLARVRDCWASAFGARVLFYRMRQVLSPDMAVAVVVQRMIPSLKSGVIFTADPATHDATSIVIEGAEGLGESVVQGRVTPERYVLDKVTRSIRISAPPPSGQLVLSSAEVDSLAQLALRAEKHFGVPQDLEFAIDDSGIYLTQTRPITTLGAVASASPKSAPAVSTARPIARGLGASPGIATGAVRVLAKPSDPLEQGEVLVAHFTSPDWVPLMRRAAAIVTETGGMTSHAAIVSRELGIPCIVGTANATSVLTNGTIVTVDGTTGEVREGAVASTRQSVPVRAHAAATGSPVTTATRIYVNLDDPAQAESVAARDVDGVGLLRAEFMLLEALGGEHPKQLLAAGKRDEIVRRLAEPLARIARAFHPRPVVYRAMDFRSNEFRALRGGETHEPLEANPMIGYRGCYRYTVDRELFGTELLALYEARQLSDNLHLMIPFVRTAWELQQCLDMVKRSRLRRLRGMQQWIMAEVPSVIWRLPEYAAMGVTAVSIGSNDLTQLILGVDRDNERLSQLFDERDAAVLAAIREIVTRSHRAGLTVSICGQAPSVHPEYADFLVRCGIDSISVVPDSIERTRRNVARAEQALILGRARRDCRSPHRR